MITTAIQPGTNIFDVVVETFGTIEALFDVVQLNGVGVTGELPPGTLINTPVTVYSPVSVDIPTPPSQPYDSVEVQPGQSILDVTVQMYGGIEGLFDLAQKNVLSPTDNISAGIVVAGNAPVDKNMRNIIKGLGIIPATAVNETEAEELTPEGIGYWAIGIDFKTS